jgi:sRNA-binding carbon storage regulator CsrA
MANPNYPSGARTRRASSIMSRSLAQRGVMPHARGLVLGRRDGESIVIELADGTDITVTVVQSLATRVRFHIDAPRALNVRRSELPTRRRGPETFAPAPAAAENAA